MMELSRRNLLKKLYSILNKLITKKTRIEEEKEEGIRSSNIEIIQNPRDQSKAQLMI